MKRSWILRMCLVPVFVAAFANLMYCETIDLPDAFALDARLRGNPGSFSLCEPRDLGARSGEWVYVIRYHENDVSGHGRRFGLVMMRSMERRECELWLFRNEELGDIGRRSREDPREAPNAVKTLPKEVADLLYAVWVRALVRSEYGGRRVTTKSDHFYISVRDLANGVMSAETQRPEEGKVTGALVEIARSAREMVETPDGQRSDELLVQLREACLEFLSGFPADSR